MTARNVIPSSTDINSATTTDIHTPSSSHIIGRIIIAADWKTRVRIKDISAEVRPSLSAVKNGKVYYLEKSLFHNKPNSRFAEAYKVLAQYLYPDAEF